MSHVNFCLNDHVPRHYFCNYFCNFHVDSKMVKCCISIKESTLSIVISMYILSVARHHVTSQFSEMDL